MKNRQGWDWNAINGLSLLDELFGLSLVSKLFVLPFLACSLIVTLQTLGEWFVWTNLHLFGKTTEATIVGQHKSYNEDLISYHLEYQYQINETDIRSSEEVSISLYTDWETDDAITIRYLPLLPAISRIEGNTSQRNYMSALSCWLNVFVFQLALLILVYTRPPTTALARKRISIASIGGCTMLVVTIGAWLAELAVLASLGVYRGVAGLGVGLLAGLIAALFAWRPWQARPD